MEYFTFPFNVREGIYKKLDERSIQTLRLVNSMFKDEIDTAVGLKFEIGLNEVSHEMFQRLSQIRARSLKFFPVQITQPNFSYPSINWNFPNAVKVLEMGEHGSMICMEKEFLLNFLNDFGYLKILRIINPSFISGNDMENWESTVEAINKLKVLETLEISSYIGNAGGFLLCHFLTHLNSPVLKSISLSHYLHVIPGHNELYSAPWSTIFKFISRHYKSIRELTLSIAWNGALGMEAEIEDWSWMESQKEGIENLKKMEDLTELKISKSDVSLGVRGPNHVTQILTDLMQQQRKLQAFEWNGGELLTRAILRHILCFNFESLNVISIRNLGLDEAEAIHGSLDMEIFAPCHRLKKLELKSDSFIINPNPPRRETHLRFLFTLMNLDRTPPKLEELTIRGFWLEGDLIGQLQYLFEATPTLKSIQLSIECPLIVRGLTQAIMDFIQNVVTLEFIKVGIRKLFVGQGIDGWHEEYPRLKKLFSALHSSESNSFMEREGGGFLVDESGTFHQPFFQIDEWTVQNISPEARAKMLRERENILRVE